jgi:glycosyltransferase involved in cell wall biosynthesis
MKVLYVDLEREWRGGQSQALLTLRGLRERGHGAHLLAVRDSPLARRAETSGVSLHAVGSRARRAGATILLRRLLVKEEYEILHANEPHALTAAWLSGAAKQVPVVVSRRVAYPLQRGSLARARYSSARRIVAISHFVQKSVLDSGVPAKRVEIVYEGVEIPALPTREARHSARQRWKVSEGEMLFGCVGYLLPEKGQELAVRALATARLNFPSARLLLAGDGPCRSSLEKLTRDLKLEDAVIFGGFIEDVAQVYAALDAFIFPSLAEPLGTSLLAAMAWGLPVVAVSSGGVPEYVEDGRTGLLAANPDAALLSAGMMRLLSDSSLRERLGQAGRRTIEERFTAAHMVENTIRVYEDVLRESKAERIR